MANKKIYNIGLTDSFVDVLAQRFCALCENHPDKLSKMLFLLPNVRACQNLADAFVRHRGMQPTILPTIMPVLQVDEDEVYLTSHEYIDADLAPAISVQERNLLFTKMIKQTPKKWGVCDVSLAQAYKLAQNLSSLIDLAENENVSLNKIADIVPDEYAAHWQEILKLLRIITHYWPQILQEQHKQNPVARKNKLLLSQIKSWQKHVPYEKVIMAGNTAGFYALKQILKSVWELENGEIYLYGLDIDLAQNDWEKIDENHPQFELKELLAFLSIDRSDVINIGSADRAREQLISEVMRPADSTQQWLNISQHCFDKKSFENLQIVNCDDLRQEALACALIIRQTLNEPQKVAALVSSDREFARRVISELKRWNIIADDSSGQPLNLTPIGTYLRLILDVIEQNYSAVSVLALLKHPFTRCSMSAFEFNTCLRELEQQWRGLNKTPLENKLLQKLYEILAPLSDLYFSAHVELGQFLETHIKTAENLADNEQKSGDKIIWQHDDGVFMAQFLSNFIETSIGFGSICGNDYTGFFNVLCSEQNVRSRFGFSPRVKILGPIEARLNQYDVTIIAEANEGVWPKIPEADLWMSRPMKQKLGLPPLEKSIGIGAFDFAHLLAGKEVYVTRAQRLNGVPADKSRWLLRLETVMAANFGKDKSRYSFMYDTKFSLWAKNLERADFETINASKLEAPHPCPPVYARPRRISASKIEQLMFDPYIIYARYILNLKPLDDLDRIADAREYGIVLHQILKEYVSEHNGIYPDYEQALQELMDKAQKKFAALKIDAETLAFWLPKLKEQMQWFVSKESSYSQNVAKSHTEIFGQISYDAPAGEFVVEATADRIDEMKDGTLSIIDYKSGAAHGPSEIMRAKAPQLPVEGLIAQNGGFKTIKGTEVSVLKYWRLGKKEIGCEGKDVAVALQNVDENLRKLFNRYDFENTPYLSHPDPSRITSCTDYDHLARYYEWSLRDESAAIEDNQDDR